MTDIRTEGKVFIRGEYWDARSDVPVARGTKVRVIGVDHLIVKVEPLEK
jgi:membrane-bound serine protease (ClpP class)